MRVKFIKLILIFLVLINTSYAQHFVVDLGLQLLMFSGGSQALQILQQDLPAAKEQKFLLDQIKKIQEDFKSAQKKLNAQAAGVFGSLREKFKKSAQDIQENFIKTQQLTQQEVQYIQRLINLGIPSQFFLNNQLILDKIFQSSSMLTPNNGYVWYNVFGANGGNWIYSPSDNGFIQNGAMPGFQPNSLYATLKRQFPTPSSNDLKTATSVATVAEQNLIFAEFYTQQPSYVIQAEITLLNCSFPFFAGILFNKARWLSGSLDRMSTYRLVGLYGWKENKAATTQVGLYAGQTTMQQVGNLNSPITPLTSILAGVNKSLYLLPSADIESLGKDPLTYVLEIVTQESKININFYKKDKPQEKFATVITDFDPKMNQLVFWYHGIGFMSPGCQAIFKIIKPESMAYSQQQKQEFQQKTGKSI